MFYATTKYVDQQASENNQFGTEIVVNDLHRFSTKQERDAFVSDRDYAETITRKDAELLHKEQLAFWNNK